MKNHNTVGDYISAHETWQKALAKLRQTMLSAELKETIKWGVPVYTSQGKNIAGLAAFNSYVGIWFYQGALLTNKHKKLMNAQEGKTIALRQWRFNSADEIDETLVLEYLGEAIQNKKTGREIKPSKKPLVIPTELHKILDKNPKLKDAFDDLGLSRQREYSDYISEAKREETKLKRIDKIIPMILEKTGLHDKY